MRKQRTLKPLSYREADGHSGCRYNEGVVFSRAVDDEDPAVQAQEHCSGSNDGERDGHAENRRWVSMSRKTHLSDCSRSSGASAVKESRRCRRKVLMRQRGGCRTSGPNSVRTALGADLLAGNTVAQGVRATAWKRCRYPANCLAHAVLCHRELRRFPEGTCCREHEEFFENEDGFGLCLSVYKTYVHVSYLS